MSTYKSFISYRREGGSMTAARVYDYLYNRNYQPFYDRTSMRSGRFDEQIRINLINSQNFILILSIGAFARINEDDDWVHQEICLAIQNNVNIIILQEEGFEYPSILPKDISQIQFYQAIIYNDTNLTNKLADLETLLLRKNDEFETFDPLSNENLNLSGDYITLYEDEDNGRRVVQKAPAHLIVLGSIVTGYTSFGSTQSWKISGRVYKKKRIAGIYYAKSVLDDGFGTFYLEIKSPSVLEGYWSGYDNANKQVFSGKYLFKKIYTNYEINPTCEKDFSQIVRIADSQLGRKYVTPYQLKEMCNETSSMRCLSILDKGTKKVIGFCIHKIFSYEDVLKMTRNQGITELMFHKQIAYLKTIAIDKKYAGFGIASCVVKYLVKYYEKLGIDTMISSAWKHAGITNIEHVLVGNHFVKKLEIPNYWYQDSIDENFECPQCGNPCHCSCVIFVKA